MKKKLLSILLAITMIVGMLPISALAATTPINLTLEADKTSVDIGEEITFTFKLATDKTKGLGGIAATLDIPEGLTYVANSGQIANNLKTATGADDADFVENAKLFTLGAATGLKLNENMTLMTFKCRAERAGTYNVSFVGDDLEILSVEVNSYVEGTDFTLNPATITVAEKLKGEQTVTMGAVPQVGGETSAVTATGSKFTAAFGEWKNSQNQTVTTFTDDDEYTSTVTLTAAEGCAFDANAKVKLAGDTKGQVSNVQIAANGKTLTFTYKYSMVKKAQAITAPTSQSVKFGATLDLSTVCQGVQGATLTYTLDSTPPAGTTVSGSTITAGTTAGNFNIKVNSAAFGDYKAAPEKTIAISIVDKAPQVFKSGFDTAATKTYGDAAFTKTTSLSKGNGKITYSSSDANVATVDAQSGKVTIVGAGTATITATAAATADFAETSVAYTLTVNKAQVTVTAKDKTVYIGGTVPELPTTPVLNTDYTVTGLAAGDTVTGVTLEYQKDGQAITDVSTIDTKTAATYDIVIAATLADTINYEPITLKNGKLKITTKSSGGGGGGSTVTETGKPSVKADGDGGKVVADDKGNVTITPDAGYKVKNVTVNGKSVGAKTSLSGLTSKDKVVVTFEKEQTTKPTASFTDVPAGHWAEKAVAYVYENGLFQGTSENSFEPNTAMNRGMLVTVFWRLDGKPAANTQAAFADVKSGDYYSDAVAWAAANGIVKGFDATHFAPNDKITREQMAAIMVRYAEFKGYDTTATADLSVFADNGQISAYAVDGVKWANGVGLMTGRTANTLAPQGDSTRSEVAAMVQRFAQNIVK